MTTTGWTMEILQSWNYFTNKFNEVTKNVLFKYFRASEARSYGETMIQAPTKAIRNLYFKQMSHSTDGTLTQTEV